MPTLIPLNLEVEPEALGPVLLLLKDVPGVHGMLPNLDGVGKKASRKAQNGGEPHPRSRSGVNVNAIIIRELMTGQKNLQHLKETVNAEGGSGASVSSALHTLSKKGVTSIVSPGVHALTEEAMEKLKAEHAKEAVPQLPAPGSRELKRGGSRRFVLDGIQRGLGRLEIVKAALSIGMTERAIGGAIIRLKRDKEIHATEPGKYVLGPPPSKSKKK